VSRRYWYLGALAVAVVIATIVSSVHRPLLTAQASGCDMTRYKAIDGMSATAETDGLTLNATMTRHIESVLRRTRGRIEGPGGAAELLAINPHTLRARMRKLGINWGRFRSDTSVPRDAAMKEFHP